MFSFTISERKQHIYTSNRGYSFTMWDEYTIFVQNDMKILHFQHSININWFLSKKEKMQCLGSPKKITQILKSKSVKKKKKKRYMIKPH